MHECDSHNHFNDFLQINPDTVIIDTLKSNKDSLSLSIPFSNDSTKENNSTEKKKNTDKIDDPIKYNARDSIRFDIESQKVFLYGDAFIKYKDIELKAAYIEMSLGEDLVYAKGVIDTSGKEIGKPVFKQGDQEFDAVEMTYNFKTKKGLIKGVITKQEGSFLHSEKTKKQANDIVCLEHGKFTTCDLHDPHFYIALTKAKVIPDDKIISGPAYLVIADIPMPIGIPFGFFPNKKGNTSGVLIPEYGDEENRGFFLRNGGWYFAINDYVDLSLTGDIYSNMSWGASMNSNYKKRYKFGGHFNLKYNENILGEETDSEYQQNKLFAVTWSHAQDPKARPNSTFSANVNVSSSSFDRYNSTNYTGNMFTNQKQSNISYSRIFPNSPFSFSSNFRHSQNSMDSTITITLPDINFGMSRIFPFRKKNKTGELKWFDNIGVSYTTTAQNKITTKESKLFEEESLSQFKNGMQHSIPLSTSFKVLRYFNLSPSANYTERWYLNSINRYWDDSVKINETTFGNIKTDTIPGFNRAYDYNFTLSLSTTLYGMYQLKVGPLKAVRHVMTPSVSLSYRPDFGEEKFGVYKKHMEVFRRTNAPNDTIYRQYSRFENGIFGTPQNGKAGMVNFSLGNNLEMKVRSKADTVEGLKKIKIFDALNFSTSYNIAADSLKWMPLNISGSTNFLRLLNLRFSGIVDPYSFDSLLTGYTRVNRFMLDENGDFGRITSANLSIGANINAKTFQNARKEKELNENKNKRFDKNGYHIFRIPWNLSLSYNLRYDKPDVEDKTTQTLQVSGDFFLTPKWQIRFRTDYDFEVKKLVNASIDIHRDLHCWEMSFNWIPFGFYKSFHFKINVKSSILQDLKMERKKNWLDNIGDQQE
ncbi:MAG: hypothetical protein A2275_05045 [Bacteroidetes bacterium RIFOXYA12_FULL_35_11]|nr:MAG: hypothetical protein A2X01_12890 [Bacteroidetes bacterium GWF2_35_48]OFY73909.1 MAG: hypothetical protein A2275_05045 [Bacteroidetes bacterium RIFOXYA12_FULL_35_11]OFY97014.1 MAG: hypothetical protein A2491_17215 [Bacteroidetes bacterium RIFOXYC12_FULL_35_7]